MTPKTAGKGRAGEKGPTRRLLIVLVAAFALINGGVVLATAQDQVVLTPITDDFVVQQDGVIVGLHDDAASAEAAAAALKVDDPESIVLFGHRSLVRIDLADSPPTTSPPTTSPPTTAPTTTTTAPPTTTTAPPKTTTTASPSGELVWGKDASQPDLNWTRPALGKTYVDGSYNTSIRRVSDATGTRFNRNTYSRRQAENADGTLFMTYHGDATYNVYERQTLELVRTMDAIHPDGEPQWHPTNPNLIRHIEGPNSYVGDLRLYEADVRTGQTRVIADLTDRIQATIPNARYMKDRAEGSPSADGNRWAWLVHDSSEKIVGMVSYDLSTDTVLGLTSNLLTGAGSLDWVSMSPTGQHVVASYGGGTYAFDVDFSDQQRLSQTAEHSDIAINAAGHDAYVHIDFSSGPDGGWLLSDDLTTGQRSRIFDLYDRANTSIHVSGKGYQKPGWAVVSTYNCKVDGAWSCGKVMAVELADNGRILHLAHTHNCGDNYWTETHASVNRDFTRVYFNSDSGSCGIDAEVMEITVPAFN